MSSFFVKRPGGQSYIPPTDQEDEDPDVSLITGGMRSQDLLIREPTESTCGSSVVLRNQTMTVANANSAGAFSYRTFQHFRQQNKCFFTATLFSFQLPSWQSEAGEVWSRSWERLLWSKQ